MRARRKLMVVAVAAVAAMLVAGVAFATIPDAGGAIHGCYARSGGTLRVIDTTIGGCKSSETSLSWNVQGPAGPAGPQGPAGAQGPSGPAGPEGTSHAYLATAHDAPVGLDTYSQVITTDVPDGTYAISAQIATTTSIFSTPAVSCLLSIDGSSIAQTQSGADSTSPTTLPIDWAATLGGGTNQVSVLCESTDNATTARVNLTLLKVDALN